MNKTSHQIRTFARLLIDHDELGCSPSGATAPHAFHLSDKLRIYLSTLMGNAGFGALLSRALALAAAELPRLRTVRVKEDGTFDGLDDLHLKLKPAEFLECRVVLLTHLLALLTAFIGEILMVRLVREVWPKVPLHDLDLGIGVKK